MCSASESANGSTSAGSSCFGTGPTGPAGMCTTRKPGSTTTTGGCSAWSARVKTSQATPARANADASARTYTFMPPPSPAPGCANGEVCTLSMASRLTDMSVEPTWGFERRCSAGLLRVGFGHLLGALPLERPVDVDQRLLLAFADRRIAQDLRFELGIVLALLEDARPHVQRLGRDAQPLRDRLKHFGRGLAQPAFDLAEIRVGDVRDLAELAERQARVAALVAYELAEVGAPGHRRQVRPTLWRPARSSSMVSITLWSNPRRSDSSP